MLIVGLGPGGLDSWNPRMNLGIPLESQTTGPQTNNQPLVWEWPERHLYIPNSDQCVGENTLNVILQPIVFHAILPLPVHMVHVKYIRYM